MSEYDIKSMTLPEIKSVMRELGAAVLCLLYIKFRRSNKMEKYEAVVLVKHRAFVQLKTALQKMMPADIAATS